MLPNDARGGDRTRRARRRPAAGQVERLESRELLAYSPLGLSLPDLTVSGFAAPVAAYNGPIGITLDIRNLGASSLIEPLNLAPGAGSSADSGPTRVDVLLTNRPRLGPGVGTVTIGSFNVPRIGQNSLQEVTGSLTMPPQLPGLPGSGGTVYLFFRIDPDRQSPDLDRTNNFTRVGVPVQIAAPLPDLQAIALDLPPVMQPGDTVRPTIKIANFGTVNTATQAPVTVDLVASTDTNFGPGDTVLSEFTIADIAPLSTVPLQNSVLGDIGLVDPANVATIVGPVVTLPNAPGTYFVGVIVDPQNTIREIREIGAGPSSALDPVRSVGPRIANLPPAGQLTDLPPVTNVFPIPPNGPLDVPGNRTFDTTGTTTTATTAAEMLNALAIRQAQAAQLQASAAQAARRRRTPAPISRARAVRNALARQRLAAASGGSSPND